MYKNSLMILVLLSFTACNQSKPAPTPKAEAKIPKEQIKQPVKEAVSNIVPTPTEFIPEHIKRSRIEVVKHY